MKQYARIGLKIVQIITYSLSGSKKQTQKRRWFARKDLIFLLLLAVLSIAAFLTPAPNDPAASNAVASLGGIGENPALPADEVKNPFRDELLIVTNPYMSSGHPSIRQFWTFGVVVVDAFLVLIFLLNGLRIMVSGSIFRYADATETIGRLLLAVIAAHLSLTMIDIFLQVSNAISRGIVDVASAPDFVLHTAFLPDGFSIASAFSEVGNLLSLFGIAEAAFQVFLDDPVEFLAQLVAGVLLLAFMAQLITRLLILNFYIVISAPCIACSALPGQSGQPITRFWIKGFVSIVMVQVLQVAGLIIIQILFDWIFFTIAPDVPIMTRVSALPDVILAAVIWFLVRIPSFLQTSTTQVLQAGGQAVSSATTGAASTFIGATTTAVSAAGAVVMVAR